MDNIIKDKEQQASPQRLVYCQEVSLRLGVHYNVLHEYVKRGELAAPMIIAHRIAWPEDEIERFLASLPRTWPRGRGRPRGVKNGEGRQYKPPIEPTP